MPAYPLTRTQIVADLHSHIKPKIPYVKLYQNLGREKDLESFLFCI